MKKGKFELGARCSKHMQAITGEKEGCGDEGACREGGVSSGGRSLIHLFITYTASR